MIGDLETALVFVFREEGGYSPATATEEATNFGVEQSSLVAFRGSHPEAADFPDAVKDLTRDQATAIYGADYWNKIQGDSFATSVAVALMDTAVNSGVHEAVVELQRAMGFDEQRDVDGIVGPRTIAAANARDPTLLAASLIAARRRLDEEAALRPGKARWLPIWLGRCDRLQAYISTLAPPPDVA